MRWRGFYGTAALALLVVAGNAGARYLPAVGRAASWRDAAAFRRPSARIGSWGPGGWSWFADPRAVRVVAPRDMTFVGWVDWAGGIRIGAYDAKSGTRHVYVVGQVYRDDHCNPAILVEPDKRLTVFWSGHNGPAMYYRTTRHPEDITSWGPTHTVPSQLPGRFGFTYANPVILPAERNRLYLFWRGALYIADYERRSARGRWGGARELIDNPGQRPYVKVDSNGRDTIALAYTDGHPRGVRSSVYYAAYRHGWLRHANGRLIAPLKGPPIAPSRGDLVYDARKTGVSAWVWDVALERGGHPTIVYATFPSASHHEYWYARFNGRRWVRHFLTAAGPTISPGTIETEYSGGLVLDHADPRTVYLSRQVHGWYEIEKWTTRTRGYSWKRTTVVRTPGADDVRPVVARGSAGGPMSLLWLSGHYGTYTTYGTSIDFLR